MYTVLIVFVLSLLFLIGYGIYYLCTSSKFNITKIKVIGNSKYTTEQVLETSAVPMGENIVRVSKRDINTRLQSLPYVQRVSVNMKFPSTLEISITEYISKYVAYNKETDKYFRLTDTGVILEEIKAEDRTEEEMLLFGINFDDAIVFKNSLADLEIDKIALYKKVAEAYTKAEFTKKITNATFENSEVTLTLDNDINVLFDGTSLDYNMSFLKSILKEIVGQAGTIDMTRSNPIFTKSIN